MKNKKKKKIGISEIAIVFADQTAHSIIWPLAKFSPHSSRLLDGSNNGWIMQRQPSAIATVSSKFTPKSHHSIALFAFSRHVCQRSQSLLRCRHCRHCHHRRFTITVTVTITTSIIICYLLVCYCCRHFRLCCPLDTTNGCDVVVLWIHQVLPDFSIKENKEAVVVFFFFA